MLALVSLLCMVWQSGHSHTRTARFFTSGFLYPQQEQVWLLGYIVGTLIRSFLYQADLYLSISKNLLQDAEPMCCASLWLRIMFFTFKSSMQIVWFSRISMVDCFCKKSFLWFVIFSWAKATLTRCLLRLFEPFYFLDSIRCSRVSLRIDFSRYFGFGTTFPLLSE